MFDQPGIDAHEALLAALDVDSPPEYLHEPKASAEPVQRPPLPHGRYDIEALKARVQLTDPELAAAVGITERHLLRLKATGLTLLQADRYAVACGWHPASIWPGWDGDREVLA